MRRRHNQLTFAGGIHFVTTVTAPRGVWFVNDALCTEMLRILEFYRDKYQLDCLGYVLMPDHLHVLLHQAEEGDLVSRLMRGFKEYTSRHVLKAFSVPIQWRDYYDDVPVPNREAAKSRLMYMLGNPLRGGLVDSPESYAWSSAQDHYGSGSGLVKVTPI